MLLNNAMSESTEVEKYLLSESPGLPLLPPRGHHIDWCITKIIPSLYGLW